ncbi:MAG: primosomal protein N' [Acidobacteriaceae bacterium]|nr:primosomal protein N' [Acidobacteriaceae bacterium]
MFVRVAVPIPQLDLLTYSVPRDLGHAVVGARAVVPLGARSVTGVIVAVDRTPHGVAEGADVRPITQLLDREPFVPAEIIALAQWTAEYYSAGIGETILATLPPTTRAERRDAHKTRRVAWLTAAGQDGLDTGTPRQQELLRLLAASPQGMATADVTARGFSAALLTRLSSQGLIVLRRERVNRDPFASSVVAGQAPDPDRRLTREQDDALARLVTLAERREFQVALLHGVTGSGKTEIYLRLAARVRAAGRRVVMLVPEIALTPVVAAAFRHMFGEQVAIQHSALSDGERHDQWQRIRNGEVDIVVGTRSAVFTPVEHLGLLIVDEEHDGSYKQDESPRYNGRDVAIVRAQKMGALVVLGSATPSMETYHNAVTGKYEHIVLERRVLDRPMASVTVVDMREQYALDGPEVVLSRPLKVALADRLLKQEQAVVLLNRRGFATSVFCRQCGSSVECPNCSVSLVVHGDGSARRARCHYCNYTSRVPSACPSCAAPYMEQAGFGTERVEQEVAAACPGARVARLDRDSTRRKGAIAAILSRFRDREIDVLVGTQMIAKGHDFPGVTLVGVISADVGLGMADFRASERTFQLLTQVAGRAGRGERPGEAIVQTIYPDHYSIQLACRQDYPSFYRKELLFRTAMRYPPNVSLINVIVRAKSFSQAMDEAGAVVEQMRQRDEGQKQIRLLGPAPAPLGRLRGEYRVQFLVKGIHRTRMREILAESLAARPELARRVVVDIDPLSVL